MASNNQSSQLEAPPPLPRRRSSSELNGEPYNTTLQPSAQVHEDSASSQAPPPLPQRQQPPILVTPPPMDSAPHVQFSTSTSKASASHSGAFPDHPRTERPESVAESTSGQTSRTAQTQQTGQTKEEVSFQFDRHVQEIRRRRTVQKRAPPPDRDNFTKIEAESGKRVLDVWMYWQAYLTYFIESLARDDKVTKIEPLQWSRMKALLSRLYDTSNPVQSLALYVEQVMYWRHPPQTFAWFTAYFTLWFYNMWLPGLLSLFVIKILNNRFGFLGNFKEKLDVPGSMTDNLREKERERDGESGRKGKIQSQLRELIHSKDLTDWISQMTKIWGPYGQALLDENICYLERVRKQDEERRRLSEEAAGGSLRPSLLDEEEIRDSDSHVSGLSPASKIKYEYQKRVRERSSSSGSVLSDAPSTEGAQEKSEYHCLFKGKPGKLVITEEALQFRLAKILGREVEAEIPWTKVDTIKKSKTMNLGIWSMPGIDVTDIDGRVMAFHNVVHRDDAFRKLVVTSGKKWSPVP
ncbi:hypothetical protein EC968_004411 [Mortierella alpina]|nr:hypothetical protein EC968_004411 [Mortierella alpina]